MRALGGGSGFIFNGSSHIDAVPSLCRKGPLPSRPAPTGANIAGDALNCLIRPEQHRLAVEHDIVRREGTNRLGDPGEVDMRIYIVTLVFRLLGAVTEPGLMNWINGLLWLWAVGSVLWATLIGLLLRDNGDEAMQIIALGPPLVIALCPPLVILVIGAVLVWAFEVFRS